MGQEGREDRDRVACVEIPALPLQLLLRERPQWRPLPVAVVADDRPQAKILWVNERAREHRILPGMRFAAARSLARELRATVVPQQTIDSAIDELFGLLLGFSPRVEPDTRMHEERENPGTLWVDPSGMTLLWSDLGQWAQSVRDALAAQGLQATVVVGFHRFRCLAIARAHAARAGQDGCAWVIGHPRREARMAAVVPLSRLGISPRLRDELAGLGVCTLGEFMALPAAELRARFGVEAQRLHARGSDGDWAPLQPRVLVDPVRAEVQIDPPEADVDRLLFRIAPALEDLLGKLADRGTAMSALHLRLQLDHAGDRDQRLEPAAPTLDCKQLLDLLRLRLDAMELPAGVESFELQLEGQRTDPRQIALFRTRARRDLEAAERALARLRAALGPQAVTRPSLRAAHLPEARLQWNPTVRMRFPDDRKMQIAGEQMPRQRRLLMRPQQIPGPPKNRKDTDGWLIAPNLGPVVSQRGPYRASGGWWVREVQRDYYYVRTSKDAVLWVFHDRARRRWFLQGWCE